MERREKRDTLDVLTWALLDDPSFVAMFGSDPTRRRRPLRTLNSVIISGMTQPPFVARIGNRIVGAAAVSPPDTCFYRQMQTHTRRFRFAGRTMTVEMPLLSLGQIVGLLSLGLKALERASVVGNSGIEHDPAGRHWHIELLGVEPALQSQGIGGKLMEAVQRQADAAGEPLHLETAKPENVSFYQHRGFEVTAETCPLGVTMWQMDRPAA